jgi:catechol 2,3-dioxygenase
MHDPEELDALAAPAEGAIDAHARMGAVELTVADLPRSLDYYTGAIGLQLIADDDLEASLGADGRELLHLRTLRDARPADGYTGLFHFALLVPERLDLARWLAHAATTQVGLTGASDHFVSEAIYLRDPDGHGIEIYWDRPRELWEGQVRRMGTWPLDVASLLDELDDPHAPGFTGLPGGTTMGHVHLRVADVDETVRFYRDGLGLGLMVQLGPQAAFLSAGGYHHHLGANTWESRGAPPAPPGYATLDHATIVLPDAEERDRVAARLEDAGHRLREWVVRDPSHNAILLEVQQ